MGNTTPTFNFDAIFSGQSRDDPLALWGDLSNIDFTGTFSLSGSQMLPEMGYHIAHDEKVTRSEQYMSAAFPALNTSHQSLRS